MKRFLMFLVIAIAVVSLGLTIYYFSTDNEVIYIKSSYLVVEKGDNIQVNSLLDFKNRNEHTTLSYGLKQSQETLSVNDGYYSAKNGGESKIVISTNNRNYSQLVIDVLVCDGSTEYPYIIKTEEDLKKIGNDEKYTSASSYKLGNDIELTEEWSPISNYGGVFDGNYFTISNMAITQTSAETDAGFVSVLTEQGVIQNLFLTNISINVENEYVGAFAGTNKGTIKTSEATGTITNNKSVGTVYVGGVAGRNLYTTNKAKIDRCGFDGTIFTNGTQQVAGGVVGQNQGGMVSECYYRGIVKNGDSKFGGIVGVNEGIVSSTADIYDSYFYLKDVDAKTNFTNIYGVAYQNSASENMVTGCYYGGKFVENEIDKTSTINFTSQSNGYLASGLNAVDEENQFKNKTKFVTTESNADEGIRYWNFSSVWEMANNQPYPILNVYSSVGSTYLIDVSTIVVGTDIVNAEQLYKVLASKPDAMDKTYKLAAHINLDPNSAGGFVWGDQNHPIPDTIFNREIINSTDPEGNPYTITNLTINNPTPNGNVGLVKKLGASAVISGLIIDNVTITGENGNFVGVLAGENDGANIYDVQISNVNVNISGKGFGTFFGRAGKYEGHGIKNVVVKFVDIAEGKYFVYAGGIAGLNLATITATTEVYNYIYDLDLTANFVGGVVGQNGGTISYTTATDIKFNKTQNSQTIANVYSGTYGLFVGGIAGVNSYDFGGITAKGNIADVYATTTITAQTGSDYKMYLGGIAGYNSGYVVRAYVKGSNFTATGSHNVFVGGVAGYNNGRIANSVVAKDCRIVTPIVASVGATANSGNYLLNTDNCSLVGGIVGYDAQTSNSTYSIYQCASYASYIKGYYAGGISGLSFGKVEKSFCGESTAANGDVTIEGYLVGGLSGVVAGGFMKNCYTFCHLKTVAYGGKYKDVLSVVKMDVSASGGLTVFVLNKNTVVQGCYAVASFSGNGVSYGSSADLTGYVCGTVANCVYQNAGSIKTNNGTRIDAYKLTGGDSYYAFAKVVGGDALSVWVTDGGYPTLYKLNPKNADSQLPVYK